MSNQQIISVADLSFINKALRDINVDLSAVQSGLGTLNYKQEQIESELLQLANTFQKFVDEDTKHKALQLAETRIGNLKQELNTKYGYYAEVRRMATGILQAVDTGTVSNDTLKFTTEEVMIKAPGYWLAPALVAISSWIRNDKDFANRAIDESLKRDDYKTTLFFMLVMRRLKRNDASFKWLERYFMHQNPKNLDREFIIVLEAIATGIFHPNSRSLMMSNVKKWLDQLTQSDNFIDEQKTQWNKYFKASKPTSEEMYPLLEQFAENWDKLDISLREVRTHEILYHHFNKIISLSENSKSTIVQLDEILSLLVTKFDDEELPLQEKVRLQELIIEKDGDKKSAQEMVDAERFIFEEEVDFLQLLTNACFNPELAGATTATQALAVSISQPWIVEAHETFTAKIRNETPPSFKINIEGFNAISKNGDNEKELLKKQAIYYDNITKKKIEENGFPIGATIIGGLLCLLGGWLCIDNLIIGVAVLAIGIVLIWVNLNNLSKARNNIRENIQERHTKAKEVLRGCLAEAVDYRGEHATEDKKAEKLDELLNAITPEDFSSISRDTSRNII